MSVPNTDDVDQARDQVSDQVLRAQTLAEVEEALRQWVREHPDEEGMKDGFELLAHLRGHYEQFLALWADGLAFMEREDASWDLEPEEVPAGV